MSGNQERGNITADSKKISDDFINIINKAFEIIDEVSDKIGDGKYLELANHFKSLHEFKNKMEGNIVYIEHERRTRMRLRPNQRRKTLAEKLKDKKKYMKCFKCDTVITKKEYSSHIVREKCKRIYCSKMLTVATKLRVLSENLILLDDMLDKRDGYYYVDDGKVRTRLMKIFTMRDYYEVEIEVENKLATKIQSLWRGYKIRKNVKVFDGTGEMPNYFKCDSWESFKIIWVDEGKIPIYRLSEYWRRVLKPTEDEKRDQKMFDILKHYIRVKKWERFGKRNRKEKWEIYRKMKQAKTLKDFKEWRIIICECRRIKVKGISKMKRPDIEMEIARQLWKK